jgi:hypothetical protein
VHRLDQDRKLRKGVRLAAHPTSDDHLSPVRPSGVRPTDPHLPPEPEKQPAAEVPERASDRNEKAEVEVQSLVVLPTK